MKIDVSQVYYLRQDARLGVGSGRVTIKEVDSKKGQNEVKNCKLLVSSYVPD